MTTVLQKRIFIPLELHFSKCFLLLVKPSNAHTKKFFLFTNFETFLLNWNTYETLSNTFCQKSSIQFFKTFFLSLPMGINSTGQQPNFLWHIRCCCCDVVVVVVVAGEGCDEDWIISLIPKGRTERSFALRAPQKKWSGTNSILDL